VIGRTPLSLSFVALLASACGAPSRVASPATAVASPATTATATAPTTPSAATSPRFAYAIEEVGPGVYAFVEPHVAGGLVSGNVLLVVGDGGALVVDTGHFPSLARKMIADIRRITPQPVKYVVTTHWHPDHLFGNAAFRDAFPGVTFVAHEETRRLVLAKDGRYVDAQRKGAKYLDVYRQALTRGKLPNGNAVTPSQRRQIEDTLPSLEQTWGDSDVELVAPTMAFTRGLTLSLGSRVVEVMHLGRGNTAGDAMVYVPDAKVLATGDVVVAPTPYAFGSYLGEWLDVLARIDAIDARAIVPGHGPVMRDRAYLHSLAELFASTRAQARAAADAGLSLDQTRAKVDLSALRGRFTGGDAALENELDLGFVEPGVERAYEEAKGAFSEE
jgi:glyoxylase-like metal-dependent hydrolase (beta-lactamase superfamily II)